MRSGRGRQMQEGLGFWSLMWSGYINSAWRVGTIVKRVEPNYYVKMDGDGAEHHLTWYKVRIYFDLVTGK
uniref:Uncharacterized protein n=1 Tax=Kalanchoe fedtschenkoi TaxID=63787 RepID=A0A7N0UKQ1_KALFE